MLFLKGDSNSKHFSFFVFYLNVSNKISSTPLSPQLLNFQESPPPPRLFQSSGLLSFKEFLPFFRHWRVTLHKKWSLPLRISPVNVTKSAGKCGFGHIYWGNPYWKTSFFAQCNLEEHRANCQTISSYLARFSTCIVNNSYILFLIFLYGFFCFSIFFNFFYFLFVCVCLFCSKQKVYTVFWYTFDYAGG